MNSVLPRLQKYWKLPAVVNFCLGGSGSGLIVCYPFYANIIPLWILIVSLCMIGAGLITVAYELGRPIRSIRVFSHPGQSWMTREAWFALMTILVGFVTIISQQTWLISICAIFAGLFLLSQSMMLYAAKGIPAWRPKQTVFLFTSMGLLEGGGFILLAQLTLLNQSVDLLMVALLIIIRVIALYFYWSSLLGENLPLLATARLKAAIKPVLIVGHLSPLILAGLWQAYGSQIGIVLFILTGWYVKYYIIRKVALTQGIEIKNLPARGAKSKFKGVKPGWE